jgi:uncharacterized protein (TIGR04255 family)
MITEANTRKLAFYDEPPVTQVGYGIVFAPLEGLLSPHIGLLWERFQPEYPYCDDFAPIDPDIELFDGHNDIEPQLEVSDIPELPRVLFMNQDETRAVQIQRNGFVYNWKKAGINNEYPRYDSLIAEFQKNLADFDNFLNEFELGQIRPLQYELTYINEIPQGEAWLTLEDIGKIFPDISWQKNTLRFLANPQKIAWDAVFELPDKIGRLYTSIKSIKIEEESTLFFEITVRGIGNYTSPEVLHDWFDIAHEWIVSAFTDLTDNEAQTKIWKRRN